MRSFADSMIIGFIALRVFNGALVCKVTESVLIALFAFGILSVF
jgi:hypothetical protein